MTLPTSELARLTALVLDGLMMAAASLSADIGRPEVDVRILRMALVELAKADGAEVPSPSIPVADAHDPVFVRKVAQDAAWRILVGVKRRDYRSALDAVDALEWCAYRVHR